MLKLFAEKGTSQQDGSMKLDTAVTPVSWCITSDLVDENSNAPIMNPHVLLITMDETRPEDPRELDRVLVPVSQGKTYLQFHRGGKQTIKGYLVDCDSLKRLKKITKQFKPWDEWEDEYVEGYNVDRTDLQNVRIRALQEDLIVDVPTDQFAQELPKWAMFYINLGHQDKLEDQCNLRQRILFTVFIKIWFVALWACIIRPLWGLGIAAFAYGFGFRDINLEPIWKPWSSRIDWITENLDLSNNYLNVIGPGFTVEDSDRKDHIFRPLGFFFSPTVLVLFGLVSVLFNLEWITSVAAFALYMLLGVKYGAIAIGVSMVVAAGVVGFIELISLIKPLKKLLIQLHDSLYDALFGDKFDVETSTQYHCPVDKDAKFEAKPLFSWRLFFEDLKAKVCKPFPK
jgi:hypothetical protein